MHDLDPAFERFSYTPELADVAADIGLVDALALQSMYIFKVIFHTALVCSLRPCLLCLAGRVRAY